MRPGADRAATVPRPRPGQPPRARPRRLKEAGSVIGQETTAVLSRACRSDAPPRRAGTSRARVMLHIRVKKLPDHPLILRAVSPRLALEELDAFAQHNRDLDPLFLEDELPGRQDRRKSGTIFRRPNGSSVCRILSTGDRHRIAAGGDGEAGVRGQPSGRGVSRRRARIGAIGLPSAARRPTPRLPPTAGAAAAACNRRHGGRGRCGTRRGPPPARRAARRDLRP